MASPRAVSPSPSESCSTSTTYAVPIEQSLQIAVYLQGTFLPSILPTTAEFQEKEQVRQKLEALAHSILPGARLVPFGSTANGLSLRHSDMDLNMVLPLGAERKSASEMVMQFGSLIEKETDYYVKMLPRAKVPIIKLTINASQTTPMRMQCDIGFENRLALENTRLLFTYALVDSRLRTIVLFSAFLCCDGLSLAGCCTTVKVWTKRRKINNPYVGTLSSYGYVLMVIYYLAHVAKPAVLPNLQRMPPVQNLPLNRVTIDGHDVSFFDDLELLPHVWTTENQDNVGELLIGFFSHFAYDFDWARDVVSIRSATGILTKNSKGWNIDREAEVEKFGGPRDLNRFCVEDPFQTNYNVARTVTRDGLFTMRQEITRAAKLLCGRTERIYSLIAELCDEREDIIIPCPPGGSSSGGGRRQSAPSPRMQATRNPRYPEPPRNFETQQMQDFKQWMMAQASLTPPTAYNRNARSSYQQPAYHHNFNTSPRMNPTHEVYDYGTPSHMLPRQNAKQTGNSQRQQRNQNMAYSNGRRYPYAQGNPSYHNTNQYPRGSTANQMLYAPALERRSSWDGSTAASLGPQDLAQISSSYHAPSTTARPSQTAPTSPTLPNYTTMSMPRLTPASTSLPGQPRSQSHNGRIHQEEALSSSRPLSSISFGDFSVDKLVERESSESPPPQEEERQRRGPKLTDQEQEVISFGEVRVFRRAGLATNGSTSPSYISRVGPQRASQLPSVVEVMENANRPGTPASSSSFALPSTGRGLSPALPSPSTQPNTPRRAETPVAAAREVLDKEMGRLGITEVP